jgi:predicted RNA-binding Zn ribbon-like protein
MQVRPPTNPGTKDVSRLERIGGHVALDLANTVGWRLRDAPIDYLPSYGALLVWGETGGVLKPAQSQRLAREAERQPESARLALKRVRALRNSIYQIGFALTHKAKPPEAAVKTVHAARVEALAGANLVTSGTHGWRPVWDERSADLDRAWWPIAVAAADLLESGDLARLRMCEGEGCAWLFLDNSRNGSRRWCSSADCGNRERVRRFYARRHPPR